MSLAKILKSDFFESHRSVFADQCSTGEDGDVGECCFAAFSKGRSPYGCYLKDATIFVDYKRCKGFAVDFLGENQQGGTRFLNGLEDWNKISDCTDFAVCQKDQRILKFTDLPI